MHKCLSSIGFSGFNRAIDVDGMIRNTMDSYDDKIVVEDQKGRLVCEMRSYFGPDMGVAISGEYDEENFFYRDYYFPFYRGGSLSAQAEVSFERHICDESFVAAYDDPRVGVTIIFFLQNPGEYLNLPTRDEMPRVPLAIELTGLATEGSILLPIRKDKRMEKASRDSTNYRSRLITAARSGDEEAMESLTMEDIDIYSMISKRINTEDVLTIVDTYFMPYGMECEQYQIMGDILNVKQVENRITREVVYQMELNCNDIELSVCVNKNTLFGQPEVGRRFKGVIWLQGYVNF